MVNVRDKGQRGEREIADMLNGIIYQVLKDLGNSPEDCAKAFSTVQRNQNQSAVGGNDLTNCLGLSIEVKRQETLSVNTWWAQCVAAAERNSEHPVLMYRQSRKPWRVVTLGWVALPNSTQVQAVVEIGESDFRNWFYWHARMKIEAGELLRT